MQRVGVREGELAAVEIANGFFVDGLVQTENLCLETILAPETWSALLESKRVVRLPTILLPCLLLTRPRRFADGGNVS